MDFTAQILQSKMGPVDPLPLPLFLFFSVYVQLAQTSNSFFMCSSNVIKPLINLDKRYLLTMCPIV